MVFEWAPALFQIDNERLRRRHVIHLDATANSRVDPTEFAGQAAPARRFGADPAKVPQGSLPRWNHRQLLLAVSCQNFFCVCPTLSLSHNLDMCTQLTFSNETSSSLGRKRSDWRETLGEINLFCDVQIDQSNLLRRSKRAAKFWLRLRKWNTVCVIYNVISRRKCVLFGKPVTKNF